MVRLRRASCWLAIAIFAASSIASEKKKSGDPLKETVKEVKAAIGKGDVVAAKAAFSRAEALRAKYEDKKLASLVQAIGKGVTHRDTQLATAAIETLGKLKAKGSGKCLIGLLKVPPKVGDERRPLHLAAIAAAGAIHDPDSLKTIEKLLEHPNEEIAVAAAVALERYRALSTKLKLSGMKRLVKALEGFDRKISKTKNNEEKARFEKVRATLNESLAKISAEQGITAPADWRAWIKKAEKEERKS